MHHAMQAALLPLTTFTQVAISLEGLMNPLARWQQRMHAYRAWPRQQSLCWRPFFCMLNSATLSADGCAASRFVR